MAKSRDEQPGVAVPADGDIDALTDAVLTAFRLLVVLSTRARRKVTELAEALWVNPSSATRAVDRLLEAGWVDRQTNPQSRREMQISLTRTGRRVVRNVTRRRREEIARIVA